MILSLDLGTSTTKAVVWDGEGPRASGRAGLETVFPGPDRAEQDPTRWWGSVVAACAEARAARPAAFGSVEGIGFSAARQTVVPVTAAGDPIGPALVWSDSRATAEAGVMAVGLGGREEWGARTGSRLDGASVAAKAVWLAAHDPDRWGRSRWLLTPRDLVVAKMTGELVTDITLVSAAGLSDPSDPSGELMAELAGALGGRLPPVVGSGTVVGALSPGAGAELGLRAGLPVVIGGGDRACEVLGTAATADRPMVSWGTTANLSIPRSHSPLPSPPAMTVSRGLSGGWLWESGLSAAGSILSWLSTLTGTPVGVLLTAAASSPAGARGVMAEPWFGGARAPWWRPRARGGFVGLSFHHQPGDLARAVLESVAWEVARCLESVSAVSALALTGTDIAEGPWPAVLTGITGLPAVCRRSGQAASAGAALLTAGAVGSPYDLDRIDPVVEVLEPDPSARARYGELRDRVEAAAGALLGLDR